MRHPFHPIDRRQVWFLPLFAVDMKHLRTMLFAVLKIYFFCVTCRSRKKIWWPFLCVEFLHDPSFTHQAQWAGTLPPWSRVRSWALSWSLLCPSSGTCWGASGCDSQISLSLYCCRLGARLPLCTTESLWVHGQRNAVWRWRGAPL